MRSDLDLSTTVQSTLGNLQIAAESADETRNRFLSLIQQGESWQIHLASDKLNLDHKIAVERELLERLSKRLPSERFTVYFRRIQPTPAANPGQGPAPAAPGPAPFGLRINKKAIPGVKEVIVVASGKGGVGKSTVSCNLAVALHLQGHKVGLLDADIYGPSGPTMLGLKGPMPVDAENRIVPLEAHGVKTVSFGFLSDAYHPVIWRGPLVGKAIHQLCYDVNWDKLDYLVVDLPPGTGDVQLSLIENLPIHKALIVTSPQDVALIDAHKALSMFQKLDVPVLGVVENMATYVCSNCGHKEPIFGEGGVDEFASMRNIPIIASIPLHPSVRMAGDTGQPISLQKNRPQGKVFTELARKITEGP